MIGLLNKRWDLQIDVNADQLCLNTELLKLIRALEQRVTELERKLKPGTDPPVR